MAKKRKAAKQAAKKSPKKKAPSGQEVDGQEAGRQEVAEEEGLGQEEAKKSTTKPTRRPRSPSADAPGAEPRRDGSVGPVRATRIEQPAGCGVFRGQPVCVVRGHVAQRESIGQSGSNGQADSAQYHLVLRAGIGWALPALTAAVLCRLLAARLHYSSFSFRSLCLVRRPTMRTADATAAAETASFQELGPFGRDARVARAGRISCSRRPSKPGMIPRALDRASTCWARPAPAPARRPRLPFRFSRLIQRGKKGGQPQALVLVPTRELAVQVREEFEKLAHGRRIGCVPVYGGKPIRGQIAKLQQGADVVVGTPGRVLDLLGRGSLDLRGLKIVVLDEADRMLDIGFRPDIEKILRRCPQVAADAAAERDGRPGRRAAGPERTCAIRR